VAASAARRSSERDRRWTRKKFDERQASARHAIKSLYGKPDGEYGPTLFVSHHLNEIEPGYWLKIVGIERPNPQQVLDALVLVDTWASGGDETVDTLDFGLPEDASNYLLSVRFGDDGQVQDVSMES
jgi:hypothetical protein